MVPGMTVIDSSCICGHSVEEHPKRSACAGDDMDGLPCRCVAYEPSVCETCGDDTCDGQHQDLR